MDGIQTERKDSDPRQPENQPHRKRKPLDAFLLSLITPGLGQIYNGEIKRAIFFFVVFDVLVVTLASAGIFFSFSGAIICILVFTGLYIFGLIDATFTARKLKEIRLKAYNKWYFYVAIWLVSNFLIAPTISSVLKSNIIKAWRMSSISMKPNLLIGDHIIVSMKHFRSEKPKRGDVIVFSYPKDPSRDFVKRIIALEGEKIEIIQDKIHISDEIVEDPWGYYETSETVKEPQDSQFGPVIVPKGSVFVLGDNRNNSQDSRHFGPVNVTDIKGKVLYIYWARDKSRVGTRLN